MSKVSQHCRTCAQRLRRRGHDTPPLPGSRKDDPWRLRSKRGYPPATPRPRPGLRALERRNRGTVASADFAGQNRCVSKRRCGPLNVGASLSRHVPAGFRGRTALRRTHHHSHSLHAGARPDGKHTLLLPFFRCRP